MGSATPGQAIMSPLHVMSHTLCNQCLSPASLSPSTSHHFSLLDGLCQTRASNQESIACDATNPLQSLPLTSFHVTPQQAIKSPFIVSHQLPSHLQLHIRSLSLMNWASNQESLACAVTYLVQPRPLTCFPLTSFTSFPSP